MPFSRTAWFAMQPRRINLLALTAIALAAFSVNALRARLNERFSALKIKDDVFALPPPKQAVAMSLGYRSALADLIFAHVLVSTGIHIQERRPFEFVGKYIETVNELDPKFAMPYRMADGLITLQTKAVGPEAYREAKRIMERGMAELPYDQALWIAAGQFLAYLGPTAFTEQKEQDEWRLAGGRTLARACELEGNDKNMPYQCVVAAGLLTKSGQALASRQFLERMLQVNDDPEIQKLVKATLKNAVGEVELERVQAHRQAFIQAWSKDLPFVSRGAISVLGPRWETAACAGIDADCATSWRAWSATREQLLGTTGALDVGQSGNP
ncbi:MAG TPA: hypothetical protein VFK05_34520 [Polyangiaceae bacterium]|nr:hypothetical protein [Polyangiaceae bacterium]